MQRRTTSIVSFSTFALGAAVAAVLMSGNARAEGPIEDFRPIAGVLSRDAVKADLVAHRAQVTSYAAEWTQHQPDEVHAMATREQVRADYLASREEVRAMTAEDSGSGYLARRNVRMHETTLAGAAR